jgi:hypothetical protein
MAQAPYSQATLEETRSKGVIVLSDKDVGAEVYFLVGNKRFDGTVVDSDSRSASILIGNGQTRIVPLDRIKRSEKEK